MRATSTIVQALASGYERVLCTVEIDEALRLKAERPGAVTAGERGGRDTREGDHSDLPAARTPRESPRGHPPRRVPGAARRDTDPLDDERNEGDRRGRRNLRDRAD